MYPDLPLSDYNSPSPANAGVHCSCPTQFTSLMKTSFDNQADNHVPLAGAVDGKTAIGLSLAATGGAVGVGYGMLSAVHTALTMPITTAVAATITAGGVGGGIYLTLPKEDTDAQGPVVDTTAVSA